LQEQRFVSIGKGVKERVLVVAYSYRGKIFASSLLGWQSHPNAHNSGNTDEAELRFQRRQARTNRPTGTGAARQNAHQDPARLRPRRLLLAWGRCVGRGYGYPTLINDRDPDLDEVSLSPVWLTSSHEKTWLRPNWLRAENKIISMSSKSKKRASTIQYSRHVRRESPSAN